MDKKILIVGSGKITKATIMSALENDNYGLLMGAEKADVKTIEVVITERSSMSQRTLEVDKIDVYDLLPSASLDFKNHEKTLSQQGWKKRPKRKSK